MLCFNERVHVLFVIQDDRQIFCSRLCDQDQTDGRQSFVRFNLNTILTFLLAGETKANLREER